MAAQGVAGVLELEPQVGARGEQREISQDRQKVPGRGALRQQQFAGAEAGHRFGALALPAVSRELRGGEFPGGKIDPRRPQTRTAPRAGLGHHHQVSGFRPREVGRVQIRRRGGDPHDLPPDGPLGEAGRLHLFADRDPETGADEPGDVALGGVVRNPRHGDRLALGVVLPGGDGNPEEFARLPRVLEEHLVEVTHAEEQHGVSGFPLEVEVLLHRGRDAAPSRLRAPGAGSGPGWRRLDFGEEPRGRGHGAIVPRSGPCRKGVRIGAPASGRHRRP